MLLKLIMGFMTCPNPLYTDGEGNFYIENRYDFFRSGNKYNYRRVKQTDSGRWVKVMGFRGQCDPLERVN